MQEFGPESCHHKDCWNGLAAEEKLDRALVAGLILEVMLETPQLPANTKARMQLIKSRLKNYLVQHLAGKVTLDRFRTLNQRLEQWFEYYYPLLDHDPGEGRPSYQVKEPVAEYNLAMKKSYPARSRQVFLEEVLDRWLEALRPNLPYRRHRKLSLKKLKEFLQQSAGGWFRLGEFERYFGLDRKTAWDYLQQFLQVGLLCHNRKKSAAVRYCVAPQVLKVEADVLRLALSMVLPDWKEEAVEQLGNLLIATGGEPFRKDEWEKHWPPEQLENLLAELIAHDILSLQLAPSGVQAVRLQDRWLQTETPVNPDIDRHILLDGD
ncbi:MAG: hypothetical protein JRI57_11230 [Deltaproteobacteria bacterium]|nr:hypothetical protein [Deltaproteobacteria bacterium]MBW1987877.1 hypothetical protein [Deltaproteobacteria bacterium]MBW2135873.1 hypothetical protein [Deltaproteobacteria bacterium]